MEILEDAWDYIVEGFSYLFSFEWLGDITEFFGGIFDNIGEFSVGGMVMAVLATGMIYALRKQMLYPFLLHMSPVTAVFWGGITYIGTFAGSYIIGQRIFNG